MAFGETFRVRIRYEALERIAHPAIGVALLTPRNERVFITSTAETGDEVEAAGARALCTRDAEPLGYNIIHSVTNPIPRLTGAIHVYGGDFFAAERSEWDSETLREGRYDAERTMRLFEESNKFRASA